MVPGNNGDISAFCNYNGKWSFSAYCLEGIGQNRRLATNQPTIAESRQNEDTRHHPLWQIMMIFLLVIFIILATTVTIVACCT